MKKLLYWGWFMVMLISCKTQEPLPQKIELPEAEITQPLPEPIPPFKLGIEVLQQSQFEFLS